MLIKLDWYSFIAKLTKISTVQKFWQWKFNGEDNRNGGIPKIKCETSWTSVFHLNFGKPLEISIWFELFYSFWLFNSDPSVWRKSGMNWMRNGHWTAISLVNFIILHICLENNSVSLPHSLTRYSLSCA